MGMRHSGVGEMEVKQNCDLQEENHPYACIYVFLLVFVFFCFSLFSQKHGKTAFYRRNRDTFSMFVPRSKGKYLTRLLMLQII